MDFGCKGHLTEEASALWFDRAAFIYTSLGYAYLKNHNEEMAKFWYQKALALLDKPNLNIYSQAFINNGAYRYYKLSGNIDQALKCLDIALKQRKSITDEESRNLPQHIINTHSNKIRLYLYEKNDIDMAIKEYNLCMQEDNIWSRLQEFPAAKRRILTDHGDILKAMKKYNEAFNEYKNALSHRKYLHFIDDLTAAELYQKMSDSLKELPDRLEDALEYIIQSYVIFQKILDENNCALKKIEKKMYALNKKAGYKESVLKKRLTVQIYFLDYRYDDRMKEREAELIRYFELE